MNDKSADLQRLLSLSLAMLERAQSESWDEVVNLEAKRRELLGAFFLEPVQAELAAMVSETIRSIIAMDQEITDLGRVAKFDLEQLLRQIDQGKKAVKAYGS